MEQPTSTAGPRKAPAAFSERSRSYQPCGGFGEAPSPSMFSGSYIDAIWQVSKTTAMGS